MKAVLLLLPLLAVAMAQSKPGDAEDGKRLFMRTGCYQCHGTVGQGGLAGPRLAQTRLPLAGFVGYVRNPRPGNMPPYRSKVMSDQELGCIHLYAGGAAAGSARGHCDPERTNARGQIEATVPPSARITLPDDEA